MVNYCCDRCGYRTTRTTDFRRHRNRKRLCGGGGYDGLDRTEKLPPVPDAEAIASPIVNLVAAEAHSTIHKDLPDPGPGPLTPLVCDETIEGGSHGGSVGDPDDEAEGQIKCETCYRTFARRYNLTRHIEQGCDRRPCQYGCPQCGIDCKSRQKFYYHRITCSGGGGSGGAGVTGGGGGGIDPQQIANIEAQLKVLKETVMGGGGALAGASVTPVSVQINHNSTQNITNQNIILNFDLGRGTQYDTSHMTPQKVRQILHKFRPDHLPNASHHFLQLLYSNPVNRNILKRSLYSKICEVFMDHEWRMLPETDVLKMLTYDVYSAVLDTYEQIEKGKLSEPHTDVLNMIVSDEIPYEPRACEAMRAALVDVTRKYHQQQGNGNGAAGPTTHANADGH